MIKHNRNIDDFENKKIFNLINPHFQKRASDFRN